MEDKFFTNENIFEKGHSLTLFDFPSSLSSHTSDVDLTSTFSDWNVRGVKRVQKETGFCLLLKDLNRHTFQDTINYCQEQIRTK